MRGTRILLILIAVVCFGVALSYPIRYYLAQKSNNDNMEQLAAMRSQIQQEQTGEASEPIAGADADAPQAGEAETAPVVPQREAQSESGEVETAPGVDAGTEQGDVSQPLPGSDAEAAPSGESGDVTSNGAAESPREEAADATQEESVDEDEDPWAEWEDWTDEDEEEDIAPGVPVRPTLTAEDESEALPAAEPGIEAETPEPGEAAAPRSQSPETDETPAGEASATTAQPTAEPTPTPTPEPTPTPTPPPESDFWNLTMEARPTATPEILENVDLGPTPVPEVTTDPALRLGPLPYTMKEKVEFDESKLLPELKDIYALNHDLVGWITIPGTIIDYPVVQRDDSEYYLTHDFYGEENINGQIILDPLCDPYTPSYNLIISGHHMKNGSMFGNLPDYRTKGYWEKHKFLRFDTLMARQTYVIFAAFYSADYDENEEGFRYNANIVYKIDAKQWLEEVRENQLYDTGVDVEFGDEFITLTTCNRARHRNGRFVVVCRRIREGETFE